MMILPPAVPLQHPCFTDTTVTPSRTKSAPRWASLPTDIALTPDT
jgi:hypothetical protein